MAKTPNPKIVSKKHLARLEKERIQQRYLLIGSIVVGVLVVALILYGILDQTVIKANRPVARVGSDVITTGEFQTQVRYTRYRLLQQLSYFAGDATMIQFFSSYVQQIASQLDTANVNALGQQVLDRMIEDKIIEQEATKLGITISDAELDVAVEEFFGYFVNGTPTPTLTPTTFSTPTLSAQQQTLVPPTATGTATLPPTETPTPTEAPATATPAATATATAVMTATPDYTATPEPTITPYTKEGFQELYDKYMTELKDIQFTKAELRELVKAQVLRERMIAEVTKDLKSEAEQVWARHILVATEDEAKTALARLTAGESFATVAAEVSTDASNKDNGGDLGWFTKDKMVAEFSDAAFSLAVGEISQPVKTSFGFHIIQVLGHEVRPLTADELSTAKDTAFSSWLDTNRTEKQVETFDRWMENIPTEPAIPAQLQQIIDAISTGS